MEKISDYNCSPRYKRTLKTYDLVKTHRVFSKKRHLSRKNTLRKIACNNEFIYRSNGNTYISKISDCLNQYNIRKRITIEAMINYRAFSIEAMYGPEVEEEGNYFDDED